MLPAKPAALPRCIIAADPEHVSSRYDFGQNQFVHQVDCSCSLPKDRATNLATGDSMLAGRGEDAYIAARAGRSLGGGPLRNHELDAPSGAAWAAGTLGNGAADKVG